MTNEQVLSMQNDLSMKNAHPIILNQTKYEHNLIHSDLSDKWRKTIYNQKFTFNFYLMPGRL